MVLDLCRVRNHIFIGALADERLSQEDDQVHDALLETVLQHLISQLILNDDSSGYEYA